MNWNPNLVFLETEFTMPDCKIAALQGGTRSGKTYSTLQFIIRLCRKYKGLTISIVRNTLPSLRATSMRDFIDILSADGLYSESFHNKSDNTYNLWGNLIEFFSVDDEQKVRGRKRDLLFANEANEISKDKLQQLLFRTTGKVILDYNPSMNDSYIYDDILTRNDCKILITTYKDNPYLTDSIVKEIELLKERDPEGYKVFGEGKRGNVQGVIFNSYEEISDFPDIPFGYGLDFGFTNDPTAMIKVGVTGEKIYLEEILYERGLTTPDILNFLTGKSIGNTEIVADSSEPRLIEELKRGGFNVHSAVKGPGSVTQGIDSIKRYKIVVVGASINLKKELRNYKWKSDSSGKALNEPVDYWNHGIDAARYRASFVINHPKLTAARFSSR